MDTDQIIRKLNTQLIVELGSNPQYSWRWSDSLEHVMEVTDGEGNPQYVETTSPEGLIVLSPKTAKRLLLPDYRQCWVLCALVPVNKRDGDLQGTGEYAWMPVSGANGPVHLYETPEEQTNRYIIDVIRHERRTSPVAKMDEWQDEMARSERRKWQAAYDQIRDASTAYYNVPGKKGHVSFPSSKIQ